ncbi:peroxiredoxin [Aureococcus anophagefferens]|nr:peroxiredoxin [Aureococcus anophagefferens]
MDVGLEMCVRPRLYYDHARRLRSSRRSSTTASRTTHRVDDQAGVPPQAVVGNARKCKSQCSGPPEFRKYQGEDVIAVRAARACVMGQKMSVKAGDTIPSVVLCDGMQFPPKLVNVADEIKGKKVLIMGLPGAFTPC